MDYKTEQELTRLIESRNYTFIDEATFDLMRELVLADEDRFHAVSVEAFWNEVDLRG